ncbi:MAG: glycine C-acetyltransferase [Proteobacteria bacterium]|nr:MAG: glycine C-acetyltransferase [Pseudomonadota bacterium]
MTDNVLRKIAEDIESIKEAGLYKVERLIESPQSSKISVGGKEVLNFCANNYLGLANNPTIKKAAIEAIEQFGFGLASVRFICGTQTIHKKLEKKISEFLGTEDSILYSSCFDANGGLFETILGEGDAVISDSLNHASIIDGIRLCKAERQRYDHGNMSELRDCLVKAQDSQAKRILIATDGVFSMDGSIANLPEICKLAVEFGALVMIDDCHATGFFGATGRGTPEHYGLQGKVDIITSTLGKALGGASGGFTTGKREIIELLRQRSRPYLFSNSLAPALVLASIACFDLLERDSQLRQRLVRNTETFRDGMTKLGFNIKPGIHPIVPVMLGDAKLAVNFADEMLRQGVYVIGFSYPVVPKGQARIRVQLSAAHSENDVSAALTAFSNVGKALGVI